MLPDPSIDPRAWLAALGDASWVLTKEAAELLGMTPGRLCWLRRQGRTPPNIATRLCRRHILWGYDAVVAWAASLGRAGRSITVAKGGTTPADVSTQRLSQGLNEAALSRTQP